MVASAPPPCVAPTLQALVRLQQEACGFSLGAHQPARSLLAGRRASRIRGRGLSFEELRAYQPGDDVRLMDWRATARTGRPQTRVYTEERDRPVLLVVDLSPGMFFGTARATKSVTAAEIAALAAWRTLAAGDRVGAVIFGEGWTEVLRPYRSHAAVMRLLSVVVQRAGELVGQPPRPIRPAPLNAALQDAEGIIGHDASVVLICDAFGGDAESAAAAARLSRHNDVVGILISDPLERCLPDAPWHGAATDGARLAVLHADLGARVHQSFAARLEAVRRSGLVHGIPVLPVGTESPPASQLVRLLGGECSGAGALPRSPP